jgi:hypothetical protein
MMRDIQKQDIVGARIVAVHETHTITQEGLRIPGSRRMEPVQPVYISFQRDRIDAGLLSSWSTISRFR